MVSVPVLNRPVSNGLLARPVVMQVAAFHSEIVRIDLLLLHSTLKPPLPHTQLFIQSSAMLDSGGGTLSWRISCHFCCERTDVVMDNIVYADESQTPLLPRAGPLVKSLLLLLNLQITPQSVGNLKDFVNSHHLTFCSTCFFNMLTVTDKTKMTGRPTPDLSEPNSEARTCFPASVAQDITHPLDCHFPTMPLRTQIQVDKMQQASANGKYLQPQRHLIRHHGPAVRQLVSRCLFTIGGSLMLLLGRPCYCCCSVM